MIARVHVWAASALIATYGVASLIATQPGGDITYLALSVLPILAAIAMLVNATWGRWLVFAVCAYLTGLTVRILTSAQFRWAVYHTSAQDTVWFLIQTLILFSLVAYCAVVAFRNRPSSPQT